MPNRSRRLSIRCTDEQREIWSGSAFEEDVSLEEWIRRAADQRAIDKAPATDAEGRSANTIRALIAHYSEMLALIERTSRSELGITALVGCVGICCDEHLRELLFTLPL